MLLIASLFVVAFLIWYVIAGRSWLKDKPSMQWLYASRIGEWIEINLWKKSETILYQRAKQLIALLLVVLPQLGAFDPTPYLGFVPEKHRWWVVLIPSIALSLDATVGEMLRNRTTKPIEVIAAPTTPETVAAEIKVDAANAEAVAVVEAEAAKAA
jgi:hypothetical protein